MKIFLICTILLFGFSCKSQFTQNYQDNPAPYTIERNDAYFTLSKYSPLENITGFSGITVIIDKDGKIENYLINKFLLLSRQDTVINFINYNLFDLPNYPSEVKNYLNTLELYIYTLKVKKIPNVVPHGKSRLTFLVRFK